MVKAEKPSKLRSLRQVATTKCECTASDPSVLFLRAFTQYIHQLPQPLPDSPYSLMQSLSFSTILTSFFTPLNRHQRLGKRGTQLACSNLVLSCGKPATIAL